MIPSTLPQPRKLTDLRLKDSTQVNSWELTLLQASQVLSVTESQYKTICARYETLQSILNAATEPLLQGAHIFVQGSIGLRTAIEPIGTEGEMATIDADAIILLPHAGNASADEVLKAIEARFRAGTRVEHPITQLRRGIRVVYADENPGFHMDITPARLSRGNANAEGYGYLEVPDRVQGWKASSPRSYTKWLDDLSTLQISVLLDSAVYGRSLEKLAEATQEPLPEYDSYVASNPLKVAIKLIKRHRDEWAIKNKQEKVRPISAVLTTLAALAYEEVVEESKSIQIRPIEAIFKIVEKMPKFIEMTNGLLYVRNPRDSSENFAEKWNRPGGEGLGYQKAFNAWYESACEVFTLGFREHASQGQFEISLAESFGLPNARVKDIIGSMPRDWTLPGRKPGESLHSLSTTSLLGSGYKSQSDVESVGRLG